MGTQNDNPKRQRREDGASNWQILAHKQFYLDEESSTVEAPRSAMRCRAIPG
jgi:hypothetical protein